MDVFKVFTQDRVRFSALLSRSLTFLFPAEVLMVFSQHRVLHSILSAVRVVGRTVLLQNSQLVVELMSVVGVFRALIQDRVHQLLVELMIVAGFVAGSLSRLAPEVSDQRG